MASHLTVEQFAAEVARALGARLVALLLYGSWARGTHVPDRSDVNTLLICDTVDDALFATLAPAMRAWTRAGHPAPLILTEREWRGGAAALAGFTADALAPLVQHAMGGPVPRLVKGDPLAAAYLEAVTRTAEYVNRLT